MSDDLVLLLAFIAITFALATLVIVPVVAIVLLLYQGTFLAQQDARRRDGANSLNWIYETLSVRDAGFRITGIDRGVSWAMEHRKINDHAWEVRWSISSPRYQPGMIALGPRFQVAFDRTFVGRLVIKYLIWKVKKESPREASAIEKEVQAAMNESCVVELQRPFLRKYFAIATPPEDEALAAAMFNSEVEELLELNLKKWKNLPGHQLPTDFSCKLSESGVELKIRAKFVKFHDSQQFIHIGLRVADTLRKRVGPASTARRLVLE